MISLTIALMLAHYADLHPDTTYTPDPRQERMDLRFPHPHTEPGRNETGARGE